MTHSDPTMRLMAALRSCWEAIRSRHPEVPDVVLLPAPNPHGRKQVAGHFAGMRWAPRATAGEESPAGSLLSEVVVVAEHLDRQPTEILATLLHEGAHAANFERGIRDCTASQYHNAYFKDAAERLGLVVERVPHYGYARTRCPFETADRYVREIDELERALMHRVSYTALRRSGPPRGSRATAMPSTRNMKATCGCGFIVRMSRATMTSTTVRCDTCGERFTFS